ncbi:protein FAR1-RELATED SEQUENCE 5-like [Spinacia oleracea]|uniref:Protein FAR1-RELATED SEQUENCE 5-like n=1 Tax=Spinacia oleracea TaxID=3562 RepID=A0ABM3R980_SPIOL|nr:protein FAR1-RELATED SEQUENCE 5-like [Spinacia oleracea]
MASSSFNEGDDAQGNDDYDDTEDQTDEFVDKNKGFEEAENSELLYSKVKSDEEAYTLYNDYAFRQGFGTRKGKRSLRADKTVRQRFFLCSYAGFKNKGGVEPTAYKKTDFRTGCKASIQFDVDKKTGLYIVTKHNMIHNHGRVPVSKRHLIRSHRKVTEEQLAMLSSLTENGVPVAFAVRVLKNQAGGEANLGFLKSDAYDALAGKKKRDLMALTQNSC